MKRKHRKATLRSNAFAVHRIGFPPVTAMVAPDT
jgi:hypothetical protein